MHRLQTTGYWKFSLGDLQTWGFFSKHLLHILNKTAIKAILLDKVLFDRSIILIQMGGGLKRKTKQCNMALSWEQSENYAPLEELAM